MFLSHLSKAVGARSRLRGYMQAAPRTCSPAPLTNTPQGEALPGRPPRLPPTYPQCFQPAGTHQPQWEQSSDRQTAPGPLLQRWMRSMETERNQGGLSPLLHSQGSCNLENVRGLLKLSKHPHNTELFPHPALYRFTGARLPYCRP